MLIKHTERISRALLLIGIGLYVVNGRYPYKAPRDLIRFTVYFKSPYRGMCMGTLVSRRVVLTAAVCCVSPLSSTAYPINVVVGTIYRHQRRGVRIQVIQVLHPSLPNITSRRSYAIQNSAALLILKRKVPRTLRELNPQSLGVNFRRSVQDFLMKEECFTAGYHFFFKEDTIFRGLRFLLQRNLRIQFLDVVNDKRWCDALHFKFQKFLQHVNFEGVYIRSESICVKDGMYGAPLICSGQLIGILAAPDAQWTNCTGATNLFHLLSNSRSYNFMECTKRLLRPDLEYADVNRLKTKCLKNSQNPEFLPQYGNIISNEEFEDY